MRVALKGRRIVLGTMVGTVGAFCSKTHALMALWIEFSQKTQDPIPRNAQYGTIPLTLLSQRAGALLTFCGLDFVHSFTMPKTQHPDPKILHPPRPKPQNASKTRDPNLKMFQNPRP